MRNFSILLLLSLAAACPALASFKIDAIDGAVKCTANQATVAISADRKTITYRAAGEAGDPEIFTVTGRESDGDSFAMYTCGGGSLSFSDEDGNSFTLMNGTVLTLKKCQKTQE